MEASAQQKKRPPASQYRDCGTLCADLHASIQRHPQRLGMWLEDALVIHESCAAEIVAAAMDAVSTEPELVRAILETAIHTAPNREKEIRLAAKRFTVPAAQPMTEPVEEIRRAVVMAAPEQETVVEVRRALLPDKVEPQPIEEIRRAVIAEDISVKPPVTECPEEAET